MTTTLMDLKPSQITPHKSNVRRDVGDVTELAASITAKGILEPLIVAPTDKPDRYVLIAGHRRHAAAKQAKVKTVPCLVRDDLTDHQAQLEHMLIENLQRTDLTAVEEAAAYQQLLEFPGVTQTSLATATGRPKATIALRLKLGKLPASTLDKVHAGQISLGDATELAAFAGTDAFADLARVAGTDSFAYRLRNEKDNRSRARAVERCRRELTAAGVRILETPSGQWRVPGTIELHGDGIEEHRDCPGFAAYIRASTYSPTADIVYCCDQPDLHRPAADAGDDAIDPGEQQWQAEREALAAADVVRWEYLHDYLTDGYEPGTALDIARQALHARVKNLGGYRDDALKPLDAILGVTAGDKKARARAIDALNLEQSTLLADMISNQFFYYLTMGRHDLTNGAVKKWRDRLTNVYGYTWQPIEQQIIDADQAERDQAKADREAEMQAAADEASDEEVDVDLDAIDPDPNSPLDDLGDDEDGDL